MLAAVISNITRSLIVTLCLIFLSINCQAQWKQLQPGLSYQQLALSKYNPFSRLHAFKISLNNYQLNLSLSKEHNIVSIAEKENALIAINGGFFTPSLQPLGLRVKNGQIKQAIKSISWWGIFYIRNNQASLVNYQQYKHSNNIELAIQSGPRLVIANTIPKLKPGNARRTAIGYQDNKTLIIAATEHASITTTTMAHLLRDKLGCQYALNLDGGSSTQLYAHIGTFTQQIIGTSQISDMLYITKK